MSEPSAAAAPRWSRPVVAVPTLAALAVVGGQLPSFSSAATLYVLTTGGALCWLGLTAQPPRTAAADRRASGVGWALVPLVPLVLLGGVELVSFLHGSTHEHPTLSRLADPALELAPVRSLAYFAWLTAFWALVRR